MMVGFGRSVSCWILCFAALSFGIVGDASAQGLGPFLWKLDPYCNTLTVTAFPDAGGFRLAGFDDQCGASQRAPIAGMATPNPDGTFAFTFVVIAPDGRVSHTSAALNPNTVSGPWTDSVGQTGLLMFGVAPGGGPVRPLSSGGELQQRITGTCSGGQFVQVIGQDGSVTCATAPSSTGDITAVLPGAGLTGGAATGDATLSVNPAQVQARVSATCSAGQFFVGIGVDGLPTCSAGTGGQSVALGVLAMSTNAGVLNVGVGEEALRNNTSGAANVAIGYSALWKNQSGSSNIAIGTAAGNSLELGNSNIYIGNSGAAFDSNVIRIGGPQSYQTFIGGVRGVTTGWNNALQVVIDSDGQLGTLSSSRRYKQDIVDIGERSRGLFNLRPVTFRYIGPAAHGDTTPEYGLIAEEVADVFPDLVVRNAAGEIETVQYHKLTPMLLNELQRQERMIHTLQERLAALEESLRNRER